MKQIFKPEFINRIDDIIVFHALTQKEIKSIVNILLNQLKNQVQSQMDIRLKFNNSLRQYLANESYDKKYGARPLRRMIQNKVENRLAEEVLAGTVQKGDQVTISAKGKQIQISVAEKGQKKV